MQETRQSVWGRFWFTPSWPQRLAAARVIVSVHALWVLLSRDLAGVSALPEPFWRGVSTSTQWRFLVFPGHAGFETALSVVAAIALVAVALGVRTRIFGVVAAVILYHLSPLEAFLTSTDLINRGFTLAIPSLLVLAASPSDAAWSLAPTREGIPQGAPSGDFTWPLMLIRLLVVHVYFFGFIGKIVDGGPAWFTLENMRRQFVYASHVAPGQELTGLGPIIADSPLLVALALVGVVIVELGFPLVLFSQRARRVLVPAALLMHVVVLLTMQIFFVAAPYLLVFIEWGGSVPQAEGAADPGGERVPREVTDEAALGH